MFAITVTLPCVLAGIVAALLFFAYPLPDILVLLWVSTGVFSPVVPRLSRYERFDFESRLFAVVRGSMLNAKGSLLVILATLPVLSNLIIFVGLPVVLAPVFVAELPRFLATVTATPVETLLRLSAAIGLLLCFIAAALYVVWFWLCLYRRLPIFLERWEGQDVNRDVPTRPPLLTVLPSLILVGLLRYLYVVAKSMQAGVDGLQLRWLLTRSPSAGRSTWHYLSSHSGVLEPSRLNP